MNSVPNVDSSSHTEDATRTKMRGSEPSTTRAYRLTRSRGHGRSAMAIRSRLVKLGRNPNDPSAMGDGGPRIKPQATQQVMVTTALCFRLATAISP